MSDQIHYEDRYVAFLDILGFKELMQDERNIELIYDSLFSAKMFPEAIRLGKEKNIRLLARFSDIELTVISDSIILSIPIGTGNLKKLVQATRGIWIANMTSRIPIRGAITRGSVFHRDGLIFGPGVVHAYKLQEEMACYHRLLIDENIVDDEPELDGVFHKDIDGQWVISIIADLLLNGHTEEVPEIYDFVLEQEKKYADKTHILKKYAMLHEHMNLALQQVMDDERVALIPERLVAAPELPEGCLRRSTCRGCQFYQDRKLYCEEKS